MLFARRNYVGLMRVSGANVSDGARALHNTLCVTYERSKDGVGRLMERTAQKWPRGRRGCETETSFVKRLSFCSTPGRRTVGAKSERTSRRDRKSAVFLKNEKTSGEKKKSRARELDGKNLLLSFPCTYVAYIYITFVLES